MSAWDLLYSTDSALLVCYILYPYCLKRCQNFQAEVTREVGVVPHLEA